MQIHKIFVDDVNRILRYQCYSYKDRKDPEKSREMAFIYLRFYGRGMNILQMSRIFNGGPRGYEKDSTLPYMRKIIEALKNGCNS